MNRILCLVSLVLACAAAAIGGSGGSAYSIFGIGDLRYNMVNLIPTPQSPSP